MCVCINVCDISACMSVGVHFIISGSDVSAFIIVHVHSKCLYARIYVCLYILYLHNCI